MKFEGKRVLVTGAAGGIGAAITEAFRREGASIAAADLEGNSQIDADIWLAGDLSDGAYADSLPGQAAAALGGLDIIANNAGFMSRGAVTDTSDARNKTTSAISSGEATCPIGTVDPSAPTAVAGSKPRLSKPVRSIGVSTSFGQTALIRMRWRAWSIPMHCVSDASAAFVMQ